MEAPTPRVGWGNDSWRLRWPRRTAGKNLSSPDRHAAAIIGAIVLASCAILVVTGSAGLASLPVVLTAVAYVGWTRPLRYTVWVFLFACLAVFEPPKGPAGEVLASGPLWTYLVRPANQFLSVYLSGLTGISFFSMSGQEFVYVLLFIVVLVRSLRGTRLDAEGRIPSANALIAFVLIELAAVVLLEVSGTIRGGDARASLFQVRAFLWLPILTVIFSYAFRGPRDFLTVAVVATAAASVKIAFGLYFITHDAWAKGIEPEMMTTHHDSVLFVSVLFVWCAAWLHQRRTRRLLPTLLVIGWIGTGIFVNSRRMAYLSLLASFVVYYVLLQGPVKRRIKQLLLCAFPVVVLYLVASRTHTTGIFAPGAQLMGMSDLRDPSSVWREMENKNLIFTLSMNKVFGSGWGHEYVEIVKLPDISRFMPQYLLTPHNSVLWLLGVGGIVGFTLIWMPIVVGIYLGARSYYSSRDPIERIAAVSALAVIVAYVNQAWGDMGATGSLPTLLLALALAVVGKLAISTGAWPSRVRFIASSRAASQALPVRAVSGPGAPDVARTA